VLVSVVLESGSGPLLVELSRVPDSGPSSLDDVIIATLVESSLSVVDPGGAGPSSPQPEPMPSELTTHVVHIHRTMSVNVTCTGQVGNIEKSERRRAAPRCIRCSTRAC